MRRSDSVDEELHVQLLEAQISFLEIQNLAGLIVMNVKNINDVDVQEKLELHADSMRWYLNRSKVNSTEINYFLLARSEIISTLPVPNSNDTGYAVFYTTLHMLRQNLMLGHRFEITSETTLGDEQYDISTGFPKMMIDELSSSFHRFLESDDHVIPELFANSEFSELGNRAINELLHTVASDLQSVLIYTNNDNVTHHAQHNEVLLLAPTLKQRGTGTHAISVAFFQDICLIADKARLGRSGIEVYRLSGNKNDIFKRKQRTANMLLNDMQGAREKSALVTSEDFIADMMKSCKMKKTHFISLTPQYGRNCAWSSCAKSVLMSALYCRLYAAAKELTCVKDLHHDAQEQAAHALAVKFARKIKSAWSYDDKLQFLRAYIRQYHQVGSLQYGPDPILLAYILLKYEHRPRQSEIVALIKDSGLVQPEHFTLAKDIAYRHLVNLLNNDKPLLSHLFKNDMTEISHKLAELYILAGKKVVAATYQRLFSASITPFKTAIRTLDEAIANARNQQVSPEEGERLRSNFFITASDDVNTGSKLTSKSARRK